MALCAAGMRAYIVVLGERSNLDIEVLLVVIYPSVSIFGALRRSPSMSFRIDMEEVPATC